MPPLEVLYKIRQQRPDVFDKLEGKYHANSKQLKPDNVPCSIYRW